MVASSLQPGVDIIAGTVNATSFIGDGSGLTNIPASAIVPADPPSSPAGMVLIPAGDFAMGRQSGSGYGDELPVHTVTVSAFYLDKYEVSKALWDEVKAYADGIGYNFSNSGSGVGDNQPVNQVNWYDCVKWCNARSEKEGLAPVYYTDAGFTTVYKTGEPTPIANWSANGYRLPTEAEWEKASRGTLVGNTYPWGNTIGGGDANYRGSGDPFDEGTTAVGYYDGGQVPAGLNRANGYGLYDMAGNVREWCWDWYDNSWYDNAGATTPDTRGPNTASGARVLRGGSWFSSTIDLRCANRDYGNPVGVISINGFRSARGLFTDDDFGSYAGDGLPDDWQVQYFGEDNADAGPNVDADGDGDSNLYEYHARLLPNDPTSFLSITLTPDATEGGALLTLSPGKAGVTYAVSTKDSLLDTDWIPLTTMVGSDGMLEVTDMDASGLRRFYIVTPTRTP
jgi:formylglycine-generating enzyme required for sulfatase activity